MCRSTELYLKLLSVLIYLISAQATNSPVCKANLTSLNNEPINITEIHTPFISKCCGENEVVFYNASVKYVTCTNVIKLKHLNLTLDYSDLKIYKPDVENKPVVSNKTFSDIFKMQNRNFIDSTCSQILPKIFDTFLLEDGRFKGFFNNQGNYWLTNDPETYCVDRFVVYKSQNESRAKFIYFVAKTTENDTKSFVAIGMIISTIFMFLVLVVHFMLPKLRNLGGMLLMAHVATLLFVYIMKSHYILNHSSIHWETCEKFFSPLLYFLILSSMLWLNTMSFNIWRTFRGYKLILEKEEKKMRWPKFRVYASYAWGVALLMTIFVVVVDKDNFSAWPGFVKPTLKLCLTQPKPNQLYLYAPIGILTLMNIVLFGMTTFNMWSSAQAFKKYSKSSKSTNASNHSCFRLYLKVSLITGVSWVIEVLQTFVKEDDIPRWLYNVINAYNIFIGVLIFIVFIFNTNTVISICTKYNIKCKYYQEPKTATHSTSTRSTFVSLRSTTKSSAYNKENVNDKNDIEIADCEGQNSSVQ